MTARELARLALETLDRQQVYFAAARQKDGPRSAQFVALELSKASERKLRQAAAEVLEDQPSLFRDQESRSADQDLRTEVIMALDQIGNLAVLCPALAELTGWRQDQSGV